MAGTNDPGDPTGGSGRRPPPVLDLSASEVEPRKTGAANEMAGAKKDVTAPGTGSKATSTDPKDTPASPAKGAAAPDKPVDGKPADDKNSSVTSSDPSKGGEAAKTGDTAKTGAAARAASPVPSIGAKADAGPSSPDKTATTGTASTTGSTSTSGSAASAKPDSPAKDTATASSQTPAQTAPDRSGAGIGGVLLGAVVGGAIVLGGGYLALSSGAIRLPNPPGAQMAGADVQSRLSSLEDRMASLGAGDVDALKSDVAALKSQLGAVDSGLPDKVAALESRVSDLANAEPAVTPADIEALKGDVSRAADAAAQASTAAGNAATTAGNATAAIGPLQQSVQALQSGQADLQTTVTDISGRVAELEKIVGGTGPREVAALALSTAVLDSALRNGQPYGTALAAVKTRLEDPAMVAPLEPYAETGLPTRRELIAAYPQVEDAVRTALRGDAQSDGFVAGLLANAESLVKVRRTDAPDDNGVNATLDTIRADLAKGDLAGASSAWSSLPGPAQTASADWHSQLAARVAADRLVDQVTKDVLASLADTPTAQQVAPAAPTTPGN